MKKHIFVATDGSDAATRAVEFAAEIAAKFDTPLTVGHVLRFGRPAEELARMAEIEHLSENVSRRSNIEIQFHGGQGGNLFTDTKLSGDKTRVMTLIGDEIVNRAADSARALGVKKVSTKTTQGDPADAIMDMAQEAGTDMIVVGHRGLGRLRTILQGSVAQKIGQQADCTVVSVR